MLPARGRGMGALRKRRREVGKKSKDHIRLLRKGKNKRVMS